MPRRNRSLEREIAPDPKYNSILVAKFINRLMMRGKKSIAQRIMYDALDIIAERTKKEPLEMFQQAVKNATPLLEVRSRRVGGASYQIPVEVPQRRGLSLAIRWLVTNARKRPGGRTMAEKLAGEIMDAANNTGITIKKREDTHRMAEANRAFAHYRW